MLSVGRDWKTMNKVYNQLTSLMCFGSEIGFLELNKNQTEILNLQFTREHVLESLLIMDNPLPKALGAFFINLVKRLSTTSKNGI
jgi:hypothetical protein